MKNDFTVLGDTTVIFLRRKNGGYLETFVETTDLNKASTFPNTWCAAWSRCTQSFYCYSKLNTPQRRISILLHRWITECSKKMQVDHFDNDTLNNRRSNLRILTTSENHHNRAGSQRNSKSGIRGVCWSEARKKWQASVRVKGQRQEFYFDSLSEAEMVIKETRKVFMPYSKEASGI